MYVPNIKSVRNKKTAFTYDMLFCFFESKNNIRPLPCHPKFA